MTAQGRKKRIMRTNLKSGLYIIAGICMSLIFNSCKKEENVLKPSVSCDTCNNTVEGTVIGLESIEDTYPTIASGSPSGWGPYNVHDPSIFKDGDYYYCYSTDVAYGRTIRPGIQIRRSKDLVGWSFVGWVFSGLPAKGASFIRDNGDEPYNALWAPDVIKVGNEYRLYYSLSSATPRLSVIGLATATDPKGPWVEKGLVVTSVDNSVVQTNAIDPTVVQTPAGDMWFYYGSAWDGIYMLQLDPATGLPMNSGDKGVRVAQRGFTGNTINGNIEGSEVVYNSQFNKYYMFIAYDWLFTKYNVRVGRSDNPNGPFYDFNGDDLNDKQDNVPMIVAPYKFNNHAGWQGTSHCTVFTDDNGEFYIAHQGRPVVDAYYMDLHVRKMYWTTDGWPVVSPERYADVPQSSITSSDLVGDWERIVLGYKVVPGFADEQVLPDLQTSQALHLEADGSVNGDSSDQWQYDAPWLIINWSDGKTDKLRVARGRDWENNINSTLVFTGLNNVGTAVWGKKI